MLKNVKLDLKCKNILHPGMQSCKVYIYQYEVKLITPTVPISHVTSLLRTVMLIREENFFHFRVSVNENLICLMKVTNLSEDFICFKHICLMANTDLHSSICFIKNNSVKTK